MKKYFYIGFLFFWYIKRYLFHIFFKFLSRKVKKKTMYRINSLVIRMISESIIFKNYGYNVLLLC